MPAPAAERLRGLPPQQAEAHIRLHRAAAFVPLDKGKLPVVRMSEPVQDWDGQPRSTTPTTINQAITEAIIHRTMMNLNGMDQDTAWNNPAPEPGEADTRSVIRGYSSHPIDRRTALSHIFLPSEHERKDIDHEDATVKRRRLAGVPANLDVVGLYDNFLVELKPQIDRATGVPLPRTEAQTFSVTAKEVEANLDAREARGENPLHARYQTILDLLETEWKARDAKVEAAREAGDQKQSQGSILQNWRHSAAVAEAEHAREINLDRPRDLNRRVIDGQPQVVFDILQLQGYEHADDPIRTPLDKSPYAFEKPVGPHTPRPNRFDSTS